MFWQKKYIYIYIYQNKFFFVLYITYAKSFMNEVWFIKMPEIRNKLVEDKILYGF